MLGITDTERKEGEGMKVTINPIKLAVHTVRKDYGTETLAEKSGIGRSTLAKIRKGRSCTLETAVRIANALGVEVTELLED